MSSSAKQKLAGCASKEASGTAEELGKADTGEKLKYLGESTDLGWHKVEFSAARRGLRQICDGRQIKYKIVITIAPHGHHQQEWFVRHNHFVWRLTFVFRRSAAYSA